MLDALEGEVLAPVEYLHQRFDELYDRVEMLQKLIGQRGDGDSAKLRGMLAVAEAEMKVALDELRAARPTKVVGTTSTRQPYRLNAKGWQNTPTL